MSLKNLIQVQLNRSRRKVLSNIHTEEISALIPVFLAIMVYNNIVFKKIRLQRDVILKSLNRKFFTFVIAIFLPCSDILADGSNHDSVKIQISKFNLLPWNYEAEGAAAALYRQAVHSRPLFVTPDLDIRPGYIKSWKWDGAESKYILKIDTDLKYHNGKSISAYDFEFVLVKPFLGTVGVSDQTPLIPIRGITKLKRGDKFKTGIAEGIKVKSADTIEVYLTSNHDRFLYSLASFVISPLAPIDSKNHLIKGPGSFPSTVNVKETSSTKTGFLITLYASSTLCFTILVTSRDCISVKSRSR